MAIPVWLSTKSRSTGKASILTLGQQSLVQCHHCCPKCYETANITTFSGLKSTDIPVLLYGRTQWRHVTVT